MLFSKALFIERYLDLRDRIIPLRIEQCEETVLRATPQNKNSIIWLYWHILRTEDVGISGFILDEEQIYSNWAAKVNYETAYNGTGMPKKEVLLMTKQLNIDYLKQYAQAVKKKTIWLIDEIDTNTLEEVISQKQTDRLIKQTMPKTIWPLRELYYGKTKAWFLLHVCLTHPFYHLGQISVIQQLEA
jgi:hypothetical protein